MLFQHLFFCFFHTQILTSKYTGIAIFYLTICGGNSFTLTHKGFIELLIVQVSRSYFSLFYSWPKTKNPLNAFYYTYNFHHRPLQLASFAAFPFASSVFRILRGGDGIDFFFDKSNALQNKTLEIQPSSKLSENQNTNKKLPTAA